MKDTGDAFAIKRPKPNLSSIYIASYQDVMVTADQKSIIDTQINKKKQSKHHTKDSHQTIKEESKRRREEKWPTKPNIKQSIKWQQKHTYQ